jgi:hypothetical protein
MRFSCVVVTLPVTEAMRLLRSEEVSLPVLELSVT